MTPIGKKGFELSEGEKQRIFIARCFLQKPRIWLLDESTNSLDFELEKRVLKNIYSYTNGCAMVIHVSHRLVLEEYYYKIIDLQNFNKG